MDGLLLIGGFVVFVVLIAGRGPPRYVRLRGAEQWTDADDAQERHLDHWGRGTKPDPEEDEE